VIRCPRGRQAPLRFVGERTDNDHPRAVPSNRSPRRAPHLAPAVGRLSAATAATLRRSSDCGAMKKQKGKKRAPRCIAKRTASLSPRSLQLGGSTRPSVTNNQAAAPPQCEPRPRPRRRCTPSAACGGARRAVGATATPPPAVTTAGVAVAAAVAVGGRPRDVAGSAEAAPRRAAVDNQSWSTARWGRCHSSASSTPPTPPRRGCFDKKKNGRRDSPDARPPLPAPVPDHTAIASVCLVHTLPAQSMT